MASSGNIPSSSSSLFATYTGPNVAGSSQHTPGASAAASAVGSSASRSTFRAFLPPASTAALPTTDLIPGLEELAGLQSTLSKLKERVGLTRNGVRQTRESARLRREGLRTKAEQEAAKLESLALASAEEGGAGADTESEEGQIPEEKAKAMSLASAGTSSSAAPGSSSPARKQSLSSASVPRQAVPITAGSPLSASEIAARAFYSHNRTDSKDSTASQPRSIADLPNIPLRPTAGSESPSLPRLGAAITSPIPDSNSQPSRPHATDAADPLRTVGIPSAATSPLTSALSTASPPIGTVNSITFNAGPHQGPISPVLSVADLASSTSDRGKDKKRKRESSNTPGPTVPSSVRARSNTAEAEASSAGSGEGLESEQAKSSGEDALVAQVSAASSTVASNTPAASTPALAATPTTAAAAAAAPRLAVKLKLNPASRTHFQNAAAAAAAARAAGGANSPAPGPSTPTSSSFTTGRRDSTGAGANTGASGPVLVPSSSMRPGRIGPDGRMIDFPPHPEEPPTLSWALPPRTPSSVIPKRPASQPPKPYARAPEQVQIDWTRWDWKAGVLGMNPVIGSARAGTPGVVGDESVGTPGPSHDSLARQAMRKDKKGKEIQQTPIATFYAYTDAFFKTLTEDDLAWLSTESDDPQPFQMPPLGRYYRDAWAEEDAATMAAAAAAGYDTSSFDLSSGSWGANARGRTGSTPSGFFGTPGPDDSHGANKRGGSNANSNRRRTRSSTLGGLLGGGTGGVYSNMQAVHFTPAQMRDAHLFRDEEAKGGPLTERIVSALMPVAEEEVDGGIGGEAVPSANVVEVLDGGEDQHGESADRDGEGGVEQEGANAESGQGPSNDGATLADSMTADGAPARASSPLKYRLKQEPGTEGDDADPDTEGEGSGGLPMDRRGDGRGPDKAAQEQDLASFESRLALELRAISVLSPTEAGNAAAAAASAAKMSVSRTQDDADADAMDLDADADGDDDEPIQSSAGGRSSKTGVGSSLPFFDPTLRTDDEISSALRQAQRALREQMTINSARKKRLFEIAHDRMAYQDFANALHSVEKDVEQHWYKRQRQQKARREREKEAAAAGRPRPRVSAVTGGGGPVTHAEIAAAALAGGYSSSSSTDSPTMSHAALPGGPPTGQYASLPEPLAAALERRQKLKYAFDPLFLDVCPHSWKTPEESVFEDLKVGKNSMEGGAGGPKTGAATASAAAADASTGGVVPMTGVEQDQESAV
ncbi:Transcriptional regulator [Tilletia horrida]|nr:Transcriptional regulator [Tilletia horrida]